MTFTRFGPTDLFAAAVVTVAASFYAEQRTEPCNLPKSPDRHLGGSGRRTALPFTCTGRTTQVRPVS